MFTLIKLISDLCHKHGLKFAYTINGFVDGSIKIEILVSSDDLPPWFSYNKVINLDDDIDQDFLPIDKIITEIKDNFRLN